MRLDDWRNVPEERMARCYEREHLRWSRDLGWDLRSTWSTIEDARQRGWLPGFAALSGEGALVGWTFFTPRQGTLRIGALQAEQAGTVRDLLDAVLAAPETALCQRYQGFLFPSDAAVEVALERRRFAIERYQYLEWPLPDSTQIVPSMGRAWNDADLPQVARALARAYAGTPAARSFAPTGLLDDWAQYLGELVRTPACGTFSAADSVIVQRSPSRFDGLILTTWLSPDTAHIAQLVVDPAQQGQGLGRGLVEEVARHAISKGARRLTLLVAESNTPARGLYGKLGFRPRATFLFASRDRITRAPVGSSA